MRRREIPIRINLYPSSLAVFARTAIKGCAWPDNGYNSEHRMFIGSGKPKQKEIDKTYVPVIHDNYKIIKPLGNQPFAH